MTFVDVRGLRMHYQEWGSGRHTTPPSVVLVHGLGSSSHIWDLVAPRLGERGLHVIAPDQRGHGESDQPDTGYDFATIVDDLAGFVEALEFSAPSVFVGHSWGASVVLHFAVTHPERVAGLVLVDGGTGSPGERWSWEETETRLRPPDLDGMSWTDLRQRISRNNGVYADPRAESVGRSLFHVDGDGRVMRRFRIPNHMQVVRALWEQRPAELLAQVRHPLLILPARQHSDAPEMAAAKATAITRALELQPHARVRWFEETIHDIPVQRPDELATELLEFVDQARKAGARG